MEDGSEDGEDHVDTKPPAGGSRGHGASRDGTGDGEGVEEDDEEAANGRDEAEGESKENAAGGGAEKDVVAEEEEFVDVVVRFTNGG